MEIIALFSIGETAYKINKYMITVLGFRYSVDVKLAVFSNLDGFWFDLKMEIHTNKLHRISQRSKVVTKDDMTFS